MATGAEAVEAIAAATGVTPRLVNHAARVLRESSDDLWPRAGKGGGHRAAHVDARRAVHLPISLAVADPITAAPEAVRAIMAFTLQRTRMTQWSRDPATGAVSLLVREWAVDQVMHYRPLLDSTTLGDALAGLVIELRDPTVRERYARPGPALPGTLSGDAGLCVHLVTGPAPHAVVQGVGPDNDGEGLVVEDFYGPAPGLPLFRAEAPPRAAMTAVKVLPLALFVTLANLTQPTPSLAGPAAPAAGRKDESAGISPEMPAPTRNQNRRNGSSSNTLERKDRERRSQLSLSGGLVTSSFKRNVHHADREQSRASPAFGGPA